MSTLTVANISELTLGTAQLGMQYGVANRHGCPDENGARAILDVAWESGITCFDTAPAYGRAEVRIGAWRCATGNEPLVVSKLPSLRQHADPELPEIIRKCSSASRRALGVQGLDGYLAHRAEDLQRSGVVFVLNALQDEGKLRAFGASAYTVDQVRQVLRVPGVALLQVPINILDCSMVESGILKRCADKGIFVFARSVFLQGVLFLDPEHLPEHLQPARPALKRLQVAATQTGRHVADLAFAAVGRLPEVGSVVIGVDCVDHLKAIVRAARAPSPDPSILKELRGLGRGLPREVVDPSQWPSSAPVPCPGR